MAYEMSIEVLDGEFPAHLWVEAHGDSLVEAALQCGVIEWRWQHFDWGVVLEIDFAEESGWERFRASSGVQAALDAVPDRAPEVGGGLDAAGKHVGGHDHFRYDISHPGPSYAASGVVCDVRVLRID